MLSRLFLVLMLALASLAARAPLTHAQSEPDPPGQPSASQADPYAAAIESAVTEHRRGNFEEARASFLRAHALSPNARTLRGLGKTEFELRNYGQAVRYLEQALQSGTKPLDATLREETEALLARAKTYVGEVHVDVQPGSATVMVDGVTVASGPRAQLSLLVGGHVLEFRAAGYMADRRAISVEGGGQKDVHVSLQLLVNGPTSVSASLAPEPRADVHTPLRRKWWLWTAVGVVVTGTVVAVAVATTRSPDYRPVPGGTTGAVLGLQ